MGVELQGTVVPNTQVAAYIKKYGVCDHSKPHGPDKTVLYYAVTVEDEQHEVIDYAGEKTPAGGTSMVVQRPAAGGTEIRSNLATRPRGVPTGLGARGPGNLQNPNRLVRDAEISNEDELDDEVLLQEEINRGETLLPDLNSPLAAERDDIEIATSKPDVDLHSPQARNVFGAAQPTASDELPDAPEGRGEEEEGVGEPAHNIRKIDMGKVAGGAKGTGSSRSKKGGAKKGSSSKKGKK